MSRSNQYHKRMPQMVKDVSLTITNLKALLQTPDSDFFPILLTYPSHVPLSSASA